MKLDIFTPTDEEKESGIKVKNAVRCTICESPADLLTAGFYQCQKNHAHLGDCFVGIFTDLTHPND
jgi:hypothetical protein